MIRTLKRALLVVFLSGLAVCRLSSSSPAAPASIPIVYSTDLFHPHDDPDDHFDLAALFSLAEFDIRGIVLDLGQRQTEKPGDVPVKQMMALAGQEVPYAIGLATPLEAPEDGGTDQPEQFQGGVELIAESLRACEQPVTIFTTGSVRDVAAAYNREPDLFREKAGRLYINVGNGSGKQREYNARLDRQAYLRLMTSDLPIFWCPCFGEEGYGTHWKFRQGELFDRLRDPLLAYFMYCLAPMPRAFDPAKAVESTDWMGGLNADWKAAAWAKERNMWCTGPFIHAAGRSVYRVGDGVCEAVGAEEAHERGLPDSAIEDAFSFEPTGIRAEEEWVITRTAPTAKGATHVFHVNDQERYAAAMDSCLRHLLEEVNAR